MFYEPSEINAADKVTVSSKGCQNPDRAIFTPQEDAELALTLNPPCGRGMKQWIDPKLAAIYVVGNEANHLCKVGYARDIRKRVLGMQGQSPVPLRLFHFVYVVGSLIAKIAEADVHAAFDPERQHGEWFSACPNEIAQVMGEIIKQHGYKWWDEKGRRELGFAAARLHQKDWDRYSRRGNAHA